jgi:hypothetical protein
MANDMKMTELVAVSVFPSVPDAQVAQGVLDEVGIESIIRSDNAGGMYPALDSTALLVRSEDVALATAALASPPVRGAASRRKRGRHDHHPERRRALRRGHRHQGEAEPLLP